MTKKRGKNALKAEKLKKKLQNGAFYCVFFVKIAGCFQFGHLVLKWADYCGGKPGCKNEGG